MSLASGMPAGGPGLAGVARPGIPNLFPMVIRHRLATAQALSSLPVSHPKRYYGSGDLHFITAGCYHRQPFLGTAGRRDLFLRVLERMRRRYRFAVLGYVVMPEHFHLLVSEPQLRTLSTVMQALEARFQPPLALTPTSPPAVHAVAPTPPHLASAFL
jgi:Transposase IS200 like